MSIDSLNTTSVHIELEETTPIAFYIMATDPEADLVSYYIAEMKM